MIVIMKKTIQLRHCCLFEFIYSFFIMVIIQSWQSAVQTIFLLFLLCELCFLGVLCVKQIIQRLLIKYFDP